MFQPIKKNLTDMTRLPSHILPLESKKKKKTFMQHHLCWLELSAADKHLKLRLTGPQQSSAVSKRKLPVRNHSFTAAEIIDW